MSLQDVEWAESRNYKNGKKNEPLEFYLNALNHSNKFDLLLGYFSSSAIHLLSTGFAKFLATGGVVRLVINQILSEKDKEAVIRGIDGNVSVLYDITNVQKLSEVLDEYGKHFFECLAWLIANRKIDLKIIKPKNGSGISHYKSGIFSDGTDKLAFSGSCNFTANGFLENLEEIKIFLSWENGRSNKEIKHQQEDFDEIFEGRSEAVEFVDAVDIEVAIRHAYGNKDLNDLIVQEKELLEKKKRIFENKNLKKVLSIVEEDIADYIRRPKFPHPDGPRPYQLEAYQNWVNNNYQGIFAMATGTGKTITALNCILEEYKIYNFYRFLVLVPTISLATQWEKEISKKFNFEEVSVCSSLNNNWEETLREYARSLKFGSKTSFCILTTYATFRGNKFQRILNDLFKNELKNITLIADEAHTLGSVNLLKVLPKLIERRIGLSATPERQFDEQGEHRISAFFNSFPPSYTFNYNMKKAIEEGILCRYYYYPTIVELTSEELIAYRNITNKLMKFLDPNTGKYKDDPYVNNLLIQRKNIIHKARNKANSLQQIIESIGKEDFHYAFIYVPEGFEPNYEEGDLDQENKEDESIINEYTELLYNKYKFKLRKFTGETKNRDEILKQFSEGKLDALLAMKCLDEGVDIPQTQFAIFCSSTGNPRQYIQRRGRVLRYHGGKQYSHIYDMIIKPAIDITNTDLKQLTLEKNILLGELRRLVNFAVLAENKNECLKSMEELCYSFDIDIYEMANVEEQKYFN